MKYVTFISYKGGVGKTTCTISLGCLLAKQGGKVLVVDCDPNRSATTWGRTGLLPFQICSDVAASKLIGKEHYDFVLFDTKARPAEEDIGDLIDGCDLVILPTTPDALSLDALQLLRDKIPPGTDYHVLLNRIPPSPQRDGEAAYQALLEMNAPVLPCGIREFKCYKTAASEGKPVYKVKNGGLAWSDWTSLGKLPPLKALISKPELLLN